MNYNKRGRKLSRVYYSPEGFWEGLPAVKKLVKEAGVSEDVAKPWLMRQAIWKIYLHAPKCISRPTFDVQSPNAVHQADLLFLPHQIKVYKYGLPVVPKTFQLWVTDVLHIAA